ncbi:MAG: helix-turn-helix domain-containing protein [Candidatus Omnitrophota bacterium]|nr:helix-turn-helix domain-containing protein [Candidatus Omnitrophota bacterium]
MAQLMSIEELAAYLKLEKQTIYNWLHEKKITGIKVGHLWRFDKRAIDKWLKEQTVNAVEHNDKKKFNVRVKTTA